MGKNNLRKNILQTLIYSDIFDFPLSRYEIWEYLIAGNSSGSQFDLELDRLLKQKKIFKSNKYFYLKNREIIVKMRLERLKTSNIKLKIAKKIGRILSKIPTIAFLGISGSLAIKNAQDFDDIDLFIVTFPNTLWLTRLVIFMILSIMNVRRRRNEKYSPNNICTNFFIDTNALKFDLSNQNPYTAHEIAQINPIFQRNSCYDKFIDKNIWIKDFLPNFKIKKPKEIFYFWEKLFVVLLPIEIIAMKIEVLYMGKVNRNKINKNKAIFYPVNFEKNVLTMFRERIKKYV